MKSNNTNFWTFILIAVITAILWQFQIGRYILYPFAILGTWFHEFSHGMMALILGGNFQKLELFPNGSGIAYYSGDLFFGNIGNALVAMAGPLGPAIFGGCLILSSKNQKSSTIFLYIFALILIISDIIWIRTAFGVIIIAIISILLLLITRFASENVNIFTSQFLGVQAIMSIYLSIGYLFSPGGDIGGNTYYSDTRVIENYLILPYWFWGAFILVLSLLILVSSLKSVYFTKKISEKKLTL
ncbi:MAG: M50 family metallopeptidase [Candidatus Kapabacteria bacterium]|nr:M50 family metallopeptidase [Candidatus Kapabacteria bacterium]